MMDIWFPFPRLPLRPPCIAFLFCFEDVLLGPFDAPTALWPLHPLLLPCHGVPPTAARQVAMESTWLLIHHPYLATTFGRVTFQTSSILEYFGCSKIIQLSRFKSPGSLSISLSLFLLAKEFGRSRQAWRTVFLPSAEKSSLDLQELTPILG